ncbi:cytochrome P450 [Xylariaceae sp. FL0594]|nr:cytochrome P450 [Xylariaceae sp. FL0594]
MPTTDGSPIQWLLVAALSAWTIWKWLLSPKQRLVPGIPVVGGSAWLDRIRNRRRFRHDSIAMLTEGYFDKNSNLGFYYVPSPLGERLMIPTRYLEELKSAPVDEVDFVGTFIEMFEGEYTTFGSRSTLHPRTTRGELNQNLSEVMLEVQDEVVECFDAIFPKCSEDEWTEVHLVDVITQIVARVSARMMGGKELSRNQGWVDASIAFAVDGYIGAQKLKQYPQSLKALAARFIPEVRKLQTHYVAAESAALPILEALDQGKPEHGHLLQWMKESAVDEERDPRFIAHILLKLSFAAIHTTASGNSQLIFDLCAHPELIPLVRDEYERLLADDGRVHGNGFNQLQILDSVMKESQRFNPLLLVTFERIITRDWVLSDGFTIPANTTIGVPAHAIANDPNLYPEPEVFDGLRFEKMRQAASDPATKGKTLFASANPQSMAFGYGRHACPGRFFAGAEIKAITMYLLNHYDIKLADGQARPTSTEVETQYLPDHNATILCRKRRHD